MNACWLALGLSLLFLTPAYAEPAAKDGSAGKPAETPATKAEKPAKPAKSAKPAKGAENKDAKKTATSEPATAPKTTTVDQLPGPLKAVHTCAMPKATVDFDSERYAKLTVFFISCTAARGA